MNSRTSSFLRPGLAAWFAFRLAVSATVFFVPGAGSAAAQPGVSLLSPGSPTAAVAELQTAIARGDAPRVELLVTSFAALLGSALESPEQAGLIAAALRATDTGNPAAAARAAGIAHALATLAQSLPADTSRGAAQSASTLAAAVSAVIARPAVIAAAPSVVASAAQTASHVASNSSVISANPAVAAQIARDTVAIAINPAVMQGAPALAGAIAANVTVIIGNPAVVAAAPAIASRVAAAATSVIHHETVILTNREAVGIAERNLGLTPVMSIDPSMNVSRSS
jgi:hypothetical protein